MTQNIRKGRFSQHLFVLGHVTGWEPDDRWVYLKPYPIDTLPALEDEMEHKNVMVFSSKQDAIVALRNMGIEKWTGPPHPEMGTMVSLDARPVSGTLLVLSSDTG